MSAPAADRAYRAEVDTLLWEITKQHDLTPNEAATILIGLAPAPDAVGTPFRAEVQVVESMFYDLHESDIDQRMGAWRPATGVIRPTECWYRCQMFRDEAEEKLAMHAYNNAFNAGLARFTADMIRLTPTHGEASALRMVTAQRVFHIPSAVRPPTNDGRTEYLVHVIPSGSEYSREHHVYRNVTMA